MSHKRPKSKKKLNKILNKESKFLQKRQEKYFKIFEILEISEEFANLPNNLKNILFKFSWPKFEYDFSKIKESHSDLVPFLEKEVKISISQEKIKINGVDFPIEEFNYLIGLNSIFYTWNLDAKNIKNKKNPISDKLIKNIEYLSKKTEVTNKIYNEYLNKLYSCFAKVTMGYFNYENGIYPKLSFLKNKNEKSYPIISVERINVKKENLLIENENRTAYQCYCHNYNEIFPVKFSPGIIDNEKEIPVYIQEHAIKRLLERLNLVKPTGYLIDCLGKSLNNPKNIGLDKGSYLIEYNLYDYKLGYLIVSKTENFALVRSFKFITMTGTPEFDKITRRLRANKDDVSYLNLDDMETFINSDIGKDKKLKELFSNCGLGHIFELSEKLSYFSESSKYNIAEEIKKYFNILL